MLQLQWARQSSIIVLRALASLHVGSFSGSIAIMTDLYSLALPKRYTLQADSFKHSQLVPPTSTYKYVIKSTSEKRLEPFAASRLQPHLSVLLKTI